MPSLNLDLNYFEHLKAMRLEAKLGNGADVLPIRLWAYVGKLNPEGGKVGMLAAELERVCRWWGEKGAMVSAMIEIGFLERDGEMFQVHDWFDHSGHLATFKKRAVKAARKRWGVKRKRSNASSNASSSPKQCSSSAVPYSAKHSNTGLEKTRHLDFVLLTPEEYGKLQKELGQSLDAYLRRLNGYIGQIGEKKAAAKYTSHYHTILNWHRKDIDEGKVTHGTNGGTGLFSGANHKSGAVGHHEYSPGLRKAGATVGKILDGIRNMPIPNADRSAESEEPGPDRDPER